MRTSRRGVAAAVLCLAVYPSLSSSAAIFSDDFNTAASSANYSTFSVAQTGGAAASDATFAYDYSALGIPSAPNTSDATTKGLRLRVEDLGNAGAGVGAIEAVTKNLVLPAQYQVSVDVWGNYIGGNTTGTGLASSGSNGSNAAGMGLGSKGTSLQSPNVNDGFLVDTFHDGGGGTNLDYRTYADNTRLDPSTTPYYAAGQSGTAGSHSNSYYTAFLPSHTAPSAEITASATQQGSTPTGIIGFAWHTFTLTQDGTNITWAIDGHTIATVPDSAVTLAGSQVSLSSIDSSTGGNSTANGQLFNSDIFDNLSIVAIPEPTSLSVLGLGVIGLAARRRKNS